MERKSRVLHQRYNDENIKKCYRLRVFVACLILGRVGMSSLGRQRAHPHGRRGSSSGRGRHLGAGLAGEVFPLFQQCHLILIHQKMGRLTYWKMKRGYFLAKK